MKARGSAFIGFAVAGALAMFASPAFAQHHREGGERGGGEQRHENAAPRNQSRGEQRPQQQQAQPRQQPQQQQQQAQPREQRAVPRQYAPQYAPRYAPRYDNRSYYSSGRYYGPRYSGPRFSYAPRHFYRPYYVFRPRFSIGLGIWAGYPVTYYDPYYYPYDYYPSGGEVAVNPYPNQSSTGGISFDITPNDAEIWVDGNFMGHVGDYTPSSQPLGLTPGRHHIELREPGYQVSPFDVDVIPGQVIPFQGQLEQ